MRTYDEIAPMFGIVDANLVAAGEVPLTYFELLTILAFAAFADAPVDVAVLEVGLGDGGMPPTWPMPPSPSSPRFPAGPHPPAW